MWQEIPGNHIHYGLHVLWQDDNSLQHKSMEWYRFISGTMGTNYSGYRQDTQGPHDNGFVHNQVQPTDIALV